MSEKCKCGKPLDWALNGVHQDTCYDCGSMYKICEVCGQHSLFVGNNCSSCDGWLEKASERNYKDENNTVSNNIADTLKERGKRYGEFKNHAEISQGLKDVMRDTVGWMPLSPDKKECLEMISHKIARILNGDPEFHDSWHDIEGYTRLVANTLEK